MAIPPSHIEAQSVVDWRLSATTACREGYGKGRRAPPKTYMNTYTPKQIADLLEQAIKLKIPLYRENTLNDIEVLVKQELLKSIGTPEKYD